VSGAKKRRVWVVAMVLAVAVASAASAAACAACASVCCRGRHRPIQLLKEREFEGSETGFETRLGSDLTLKTRMCHQGPKDTVLDGNPDGDALGFVWYQGYICI
jgi:hypothetical protein